MGQARSWDPQPHRPGQALLTTHYQGAIVRHLKGMGGLEQPHLQRHGSCRGRRRVSRAGRTVSAAPHRRGLLPVLGSIVA